MDEIDTAALMTFLQALKTRAWGPRIELHPDGSGSFVHGMDGDTIRVDRNAGPYRLLDFISIAELNRIIHDPDIPDQVVR